MRRMAKVINDAGVKPEIELFDSGDIALMERPAQGRQLARTYCLPRSSWVCAMASTSPETILDACSLLPSDAEFTAIGIGRTAFHAVALSYLSGGHVRVGLEDAVYIAHGALAPSNSRPWSKSTVHREDLGGQIATSREARDIIGLPSRLANAEPPP